MKNDRFDILLIVLVIVAGILVNETYVYACIVAGLIFYAGMRFQADRSAGAFDGRFAVDAPKPRAARAPAAYLPTKKQLAAWSKERQLIPTAREQTVRSLVFGKRVRTDITRRN